MNAVRSCESPLSGSFHVLVTSGVSSKMILIFWGGRQLARNQQVSFLEYPRFGARL